MPCSLPEPYELVRSPRDWRRDWSFVHNSGEAYEALVLRSLRVRVVAEDRVARAEAPSEERRETREAEDARPDGVDLCERMEEPSDLDPREAADRVFALALDREEDREEDLNEELPVRLAPSTVRRVGRLRSAI